jgi:hypothetical protein
MKPATALLAAVLTAQPVATLARESLPGGTPVAVELVDTLSSKSAKVGDRFPVRAAEDVRIGNAIIIPAGTPGVGEVTRVVRKRSFGRPGQIETRVLYLTVSDQIVVLSGRAANNGRSGIVPTIAVASVGGLLSGFVTGRSAELAAGTRLAAYVHEAAPAAALIPSS